MPSFIKYIHTGKLYAIFNTGEMVPITNLFDKDGDEIHDFRFSHTFVAGSNETGWFTELSDNYDPVKVN